MGANKNSSPKRELGLYPKFTTKDSHTSLPKSHSHNEPTNPRKKTPKQSRSGSTTQEAKDLAVLQVTWRTVRNLRADRPQGYGGPSKSCGGLSKKRPRTSSTAPSITDHPCRHLRPSVTNTLHADCPRTPGGPSAKPPATENGRNIGSKERCSRTSDEHEEHHPVVSTRTVRVL
jgi:hypothetical protein